MNIESIAMAMQQCVLFIVALHMSLSTIQNTLIPSHVPHSV